MDDHDKALEEAQRKLAIIEKLQARRKITNKIVRSTEIGMVVALVFFFIEPLVSIALSMIATVLILGCIAVMHWNIHILKRL